MAVMTMQHERPGETLVFTIGELATGLRIDPKTIRRNPELMRLSIKIGKSRRWPLQEVQRFLDEKVAHTGAGR